jgi:hypothetical protein
MSASTRWIAGYGLTFAEESDNSNSGKNVILLHSREQSL